MGRSVLNQLGLTSKDQAKQLLPSLAGIPLWLPGAGRCARADAGLARIDLTSNCAQVLAFLPQDEVQVVLRVDGVVHVGVRWYEELCRKGNF